MDSQKIINILPGVILALVFCLFSQGINNLIGIELFGTTKSPISTVMIAILLGIIMGNAFTPRQGMMIGLDFTQKYILKLGIIFLGIRLSFEEFLKFGTVAVPLIIVCILSVLILVKLLIRSHQIRSYVLHPYRMVKDNRTNFESSNPDKILDGEIDDFLESSLYKVK